MKSESGSTRAGRLRMYAFAEENLYHLAKEIQKIERKEDNLSSLPFNLFPYFLRSK